MRRAESQAKYAAGSRVDVTGPRKVVAEEVAANWAGGNPILTRSHGTDISVARLSQGDAVLRGSWLVADADARAKLFHRPSGCRALAWKEDDPLVVIVIGLVRDAPRPPSNSDFCHLVGAA